MAQRRIVDLAGDVAARLRPVASPALRAGDLPRRHVEAVIEVHHPDIENERRQRLSVIVTRGLVPHRIRHWILAIGQARLCFSEREGGALAIGKGRMLAPRAHKEEAIIDLTALGGGGLVLLVMHVEAGCASVDLADTHVDQAQRLRRDLPALIGELAERHKGLHRIGKDYRWVLQSGLHDKFLLFDPFRSHPGDLARHLYDELKKKDVTVNDEKNLSEVFADSRGHLQGVAFRMLGSRSEAEDAVQEAWIRVSRAETESVENLRGFLTTVTARVCLDMLRSRKARAEDAVGERLPDITPADATNAEQEAVMADSVGLALLVVLETLDPAERVAFVLHDLFGVAFEEIAPLVGRSPVAARQLASRARRRVRGSPERDEAEFARKRDLVTSLLAALRAGDIEGVVAALDPDVVIHAQAPDGTTREIRGARNWAKSAVAFTQRATQVFGAVEVALVGGDLGAIYAPKGRVARALKFSFERGVIARVHIFSDPATVRTLQIAAI